MEEILKQILEGQNKLIKEVQVLKEGQQQFTKCIDTLTKRLDTVEQNMGTKVQQDETIDIVKAVQHNSEILNAKVDGLTVTTASKDVLATLATKEDIAVLNSKFNVLNNRLFDQEANLLRLKEAK